MIVSSDCGYDHCIAGTKTRQTPVKFTSCLAYAEITFVIETQQILRLRGYFEHNTECKAALLFRIPRLPLHPRVHELALIALMQGVPLSNIQQSNREWFNSGGEGYVPKDAREWKHRFLIQKHDTRSLYRQFNRLKGVKVTEQPHINLHEWLDPKSVLYNETLASAVFHYSARV